MNRDDIVRMATDAGLIRSGDGWTMPSHWGLSELMRFAALVAAAEREACAKVCDEQEAWYWRAYKHGEAGTDLHGSSYAEGVSNGALFCANAIRAKNEP